ncbi:hypothetical protein K9U39_00035 [Rhodoblastus acidophilus]|uniref:Methyltransferase type 11 domain-containing protein n=1 Tax=Candidatus Rhodoblastus alkanivorans TaxID=2954117 RepID=A0ABS9Z359_9HYPH|nr:hypothetical protein [Candidatus Rhodoblastus alkanivorans]MCI4677312.1 hypothetical protein [Candidatus Rhodoblastus alkanivorans]MCI4682047.1 hypothetical protein [Candidatus Rhodoblastus alkanivorans]MDI4639349.1 hypothetical protein [Rhodoblastus acidophilus]
MIEKPDESNASSYIRHVKQGNIASGVLQVVMPEPKVFHPFSRSYMASANCVASDFYSQQYLDFCLSIREEPYLHRKLWEFAFIAEHLSSAGVLTPGSQGIGFGVGTEPLPALFASKGCPILATDAPPGAADPGWSETAQWSQDIAKLFRPEVVSDDVFKEYVKFASCDMAAIPDTFKDGFDFCWSACCFEHLGSLEAGADFVVESVEKTLRVGGVACHTSEFNVSSNEETIDSGGTVLYRLKDVERLIERLLARGHEVVNLPFTPGLSYVDHLVDVSPFTGNVHLKIRLGDFVTTSFGIVVRRGR